MAGKLMLNPWVYGRSRGRNSRRGKRKNSRRVPGMLRAPKWRLYGKRKRRYNLSRREMLRAGTHRARRHALTAMRSGDPWTAKRYLGMEERLMARRRALGMNRGGRQRRSNRVIARWRSDLGDRFVDLHQEKGRYKYHWSDEDAPQVMAPTFYRDEDAVRAVEEGPVKILGHFGHRLKRSYRYNRGGKRWIQGAIRRPGALRRKLARGYVSGAKLLPGKPIPETLLERAYRVAKKRGDTQTMRQINLARRLKGMRRRKRVTQRRKYVVAAAN